MNYLKTQISSFKIIILEKNRPESIDNIFVFKIGNRCGSSKFDLNVTLEKLHSFLLV